MEKKEWCYIGIAFGLILLVALFQDFSSKNIQSDGTIARESFGGKEKSVSLVLDAEGLLEEYSYDLKIEPEKVTSEQADLYFEEARETIDADFLNIEESVPLKETYVNGLVEAEWSFQPYGYITADGMILQEEVPKEGIVVSSEVTLYCGEYETVYRFPFLLKKKKLSEEEAILEKISLWMDEQMSKEGSESLQLPEEIDGVKLDWSEKKDFLFLKVLFIEGIALLGIFIGKQKAKEKEEILRKQRLEEDYPDIVNQLTVLLSAGVTIRQAWEKIAMQYKEKRAKQMVVEREVYEEILFMHRQILEGEKERRAYENFAERVQLMSYRRLMRLLLNNLEKGTKDLCVLLEEESRQAYGQRIWVAKTKGEEASTKMLAPLMLMMVLVMAIVLLPAIISFTN